MLEEKESANKEKTNLESDENLLGVFSILLDVAKRTDPEKYLVGYKKND